MPSVTSEPTTEPINTLRDCKVEIYNNTTQQQELTIEKLTKSTFNFSFADVCSDDNGAGLQREQCVTKCH